MINVVANEVNDKTNHFILFLLVTTFDVECFFYEDGYPMRFSGWRKTGRGVLTDIVVVAVENGLVRALALRDGRQSLDDTKPELLALLALVDGDVLDVSDRAEAAGELTLHEDGADAYDAVRRAVDDDDRVVRERRVLQGGELVQVGLFTEVADNGEHAEDVKVAAVVVGRSKRTQLSSDFVKNSSRRLGLRRERRTWRSLGSSSLICCEMTSAGKSKLSSESGVNGMVVSCKLMLSNECAVEGEETRGEKRPGTMLYADGGGGEAAGRC